MKNLEARPYLLSRKPLLAREVAVCAQKLGRKPKLRVVMVGNHAPSALYVANKKRAADELGFDAETIHFDENTPPSQVALKIQEMNQDPTVDGILIQRPLPSGYLEKDVLYWVAPEKDVDAFHPETVGKVVLGLDGFLPCTAIGCLKLLEHYGYSVRGKVSAVIGRSPIVGRPLSHLLLLQDSTVLHAHSQTPRLAELTRQADFVFVAVGKPGLIKKEHLKSGAVVVDIGISKSPTGKTVGDVDTESVRNHISALTPVPGGIGPMTILGLLENTLKSAIKKT